MRYPFAILAALLLAGCVDAGRGWVVVGGGFQVVLDEVSASGPGIHRVVLDVEALAFVGLPAEGTTAGGEGHGHAHGDGEEPAMDEAAEAILAEASIGEVELDSTNASPLVRIGAVDLPLGEVTALELHVEQIRIEGAGTESPFAIDIAAPRALRRHLPLDFVVSRDAHAAAEVGGFVTLDASGLSAGVPPEGLAGPPVTDAAHPAAVAALAALEAADLDLRLTGPID